MLRDDPVGARHIRLAVLKHLVDDPLRPELLTHPELRAVVHGSSRSFLSLEGNTLVGLMRDTNY
jgi:hypothetical protein